MKILGVVFALVAGTLWSAFCFQLIWNWHIAVLGFPIIGLWQAAGISLAGSVLSGSSTVIAIMLKDAEVKKFADWMNDRIYYNLYIGVLTFIAFIFVLLRDLQ